MWPRLVVFGEPHIKIGLQLVNGTVHLFAERDATKLIEHGLVEALDWCPTLSAAAGDPDVKEKLLQGYNAAGKRFKVHLDGFNQLPYLTGHEPKGARKDFFYFNDDGDLVALRYENWKIVFMEQRARVDQIIEEMQRSLSTPTSD